MFVSVIFFYNTNHMGMIVCMCVCVYVCMCVCMCMRVCVCVCVCLCAAVEMAAVCFNLADVTADDRQALT